MHQSVVITQCTNRKRAHSGKAINGSQVLSEAISDPVKAWVKSIGRRNYLIEAKDLYCGRGFSEFLDALSLLKGYQGYIVSAGMGLIPMNKPIPNYDLSVSKSAGNSVVKLTEHSSQEWWRRLNEQLNSDPTPLSTLTKNTKGLVLLALSSGYIQLVSEDLSQLNAEELSRVRLMGPLSLDKEHKWLSTVLMPYRHNLDGPDSPLPGTKADFSQRALRHFVSFILPNAPDGSLMAHKEAVASAMKAMVPPPDFTGRRRLTDDEVCELVIENWKDCQGKSASALRLLRDRGFACEQSRFSRLFKIAKQEVMANA